MVLHEKISWRFLKPWFKTPRIGEGVLTHKEVGVVLKLRRKYVYMFRFEVIGE
jgi:hypothetical protein